MKRLFLTAVAASLLSSAFLISVSAAQAEGAEGVDQIADGSGGCAEQEQMGGVAEIGQKLHAKQLPVVPALIGREEQRGPEQSDELCKHKKGSRFL